MTFYMGIDLGSTTCKALVVDDDQRIRGVGLTNTRSDYLVAVKIAEIDARIDTRFNMLRAAIETHPLLKGKADSIYKSLFRSFKSHQHQRRLTALKNYCIEIIKSDPLYKNEKAKLEEAISEILLSFDAKAEEIVDFLVADNSVFFRDVVAKVYMQESEVLYKKYKISLDQLVTVYDKAIIKSEAKLDETPFSRWITLGTNDMKKKGTAGDEEIKAIQDLIPQTDFTVVRSVGTGYGRQLLPFPKENIYSEILCHGLGSHYFFPNTATVLDIGGQDTKAIQLDEDGMVTSFNMNDRCAAGCGRFLGYIADQLAIGVSDLSDFASKAKKELKISSTCTVFAGAEIRDKLSLGETRENIIYSLEVAMAKRAMSLLARSNGVHNEFTFSGGVAKNDSMVSIFSRLVKATYGDIKMNVSPDSIYSGALGAALFALRKEVA